jgi:sarcosine/dimethylglycine N-methyltransferase
VNDPNHIQAYYEGLVEPIYRTVSGTVLHLAMFEGAETRETATTRTKTFLAARLPARPATATIVDLGSGYGDAARFLARRCGCHIRRKIP